MLMVQTEISFPENKTTSDKIIEVISGCPGLTSKQIHYLIKDKGVNEVSYQATFKQLTKLREKQMLCKKERKYYIDPKWIKKLKQFILNIEENQDLNKTIILIP
jgi:TusA-related sulfurtransferase